MNTSVSATGGRFALRLAAQLGRFGLVGVANTLVDLAFTNLLFLLSRPATPLHLTLIAVVAGAVATLQSYVLNSTWTFRDARGGRGARLRFLLAGKNGWQLKQMSSCTFSRVERVRNDTPQAQWTVVVL